MTDHGDDVWFRTLNEGGPEAPLLVVLPHAGGSATYYRPLGALLPELEVLAVQYPGRQDRHREAQLPSIEALAEEVSTRLAPRAAARRLVLFGHSMGAVVAFEVARRLEERGTVVAHLVVSGRGAPGTEDAAPVALDDDALLSELLRLSGTDAAVLDDPEVRALVLPAVRADYSIVSAYRGPTDATVQAPLTVMHACDDPLVPAEAVAGWRGRSRATVAGLTFRGGHFYLVDQVVEVAKVLGRVASG